VEEVAQVSELGWWVIRGSTILEALRRAALGEDPDVIYAELYANSEHKYPQEEEHDG
jgi:hypothetical protein